MDLFVQLWEDIVYIWDGHASWYLNGMWQTIQIAVLCTLVGCVIGLLCGVLNTIPYQKRDPLWKRILLRLIRIVIRAYVELFRGTPMILQAVVIFYGLPYFTHNTVRFESIWLCAFVVVSVNTGAYMAESVRGGIMSIDPGQTEGAKAIGMTHWQTMVHVIMPQTLRNILPQIGNNLIINLKDSSVLSVIGFVEFFKVHSNVVGKTYMAFPSAAIEMLGYLTVTVVASILLRWLEKKMEGSDTYELTQEDVLTMAAGTYSHPDRTTPFEEKNMENREHPKLKSARKKGGQ